MVDCQQPIMTRNDQVVRQWWELLALSDREWFTLKEVGDSLPEPRPHKRTVMRDLDALMEVFPVQRKVGDNWEYQYRLRHSLEKLVRRRRA